MKEPAARAGHCETPPRPVVPLTEDVVDRLGEILFQVDDLREILRSADAHQLSWIEPGIEQVFDSVNGLMQKLTD